MFRTLIARSESFALATSSRISRGSEGAANAVAIALRHNGGMAACFRAVDRVGSDHVRLVHVVRKGALVCRCHRLRFSGGGIALSDALPRRLAKQ